MVILKPEINGKTTWSIKKTVAISEIEINILMELNIHGSAHDSVSDSDTTRHSNRRNAEF
jgi:hypothetical protein